MHATELGYTVRHILVWNVRQMRQQYHYHSHQYRQRFAYPFTHKSLRTQLTTGRLNSNICFKIPPQRISGDCNLFVNLRKKL